MNKEKLVVHVSRTSLAGAPIRIVKALNKYTEFKSRLVDFMPITSKDNNVFEEDINWQDSTTHQEAKELFANADIIHFHHYFDLELNPFLVDFNTITKPGCKFLRHFHSAKDYVRKSEIRFDESFAKDMLAKVVIPHCPERTYLDLDIVPNIFAIDDEMYIPHKNNNEKVKVVFSASTKAPREKDRWATKGFPEVNQKLHELSEKLNFDYEAINGIPFDVAMQKKQEADIVIGDIVTGSYHLTELEALAMGKSCISYLDGRSVMTFMNTFKTQDVPFINASIDQLEKVLEDLIKFPELRKEIGEFSRNWIEKYYKEEILILKFVEIYNKLLNNKEIEREGAKEYPLAKNFLYNRVYNINWENLTGKNYPIM